MATVNFVSKLRADGSLTMPGEAAEQLGLHPGDEVQVRVESANGASHPEDARDQAVLQAKFDRFFQKLDTLTFEQPTTIGARDHTEAAFTEAMEEKYRRLGFK